MKAIGIMHLSSSKLGHSTSKPLFLRTLPIICTSTNFRRHHRHTPYHILPIFLALPPPPPPRPPSSTNNGDNSGWEDDDNDNNDNNNNKNIAHNLFHVLLKPILPALLAILISTATFLALLPQLLSNPTGLKTALALFNNTISPAKVSIDSISLGWTVPLTIKGLVVTEKVVVKRVKSPLNGSVIFTEEDSEDEDEEDITTTAIKPERKAVLFKSDIITTTAPLYKLILQQGITDMFVQRPVIDGTLNAKGQVRVARMLEEAGLVPQPPPPSSSSGSNTRSSTATNNNNSNTVVGRYQALLQPRQYKGSSTYMKKESGNGGEVEEKEEDGEEKVVAATSSSSSTGSSSGGSVDRSTNSNNNSPSSSSSSAAAADLYVPEYLQVPDSQINLTAEVRTPFVHIYIADGLIQVPLEVKELVGKRMHVDVLLGSAALSEAIPAEYPKNSSSTDNNNNNAIPSSPTSSSSSYSEEEGWWTRAKPSVLLPWRAGHMLGPVALRVDSDRLSMSMSGWQTSKKYTYLHDPVSLQAELTPFLAQAALSRVVRPVLGSNPSHSSTNTGGKGRGVEVVGLKSSIHVKATARPADGLWPTGGLMTVVVEPLRVAVGEGAAVRQALALLGTAVNDTIDTATTTTGDDTKNKNKKSNTSNTALAKVPAANSKGGLTADLGRIVTDISMSTGAITTKRVDITISTGSGGGLSSLLLPWKGRGTTKKEQQQGGGGALRFATWGEAHASRNGPMNVTLAIPASTLAAVGLLPFSNSSGGGDNEEDAEEEGDKNNASSNKVTVESLPDDWAVGITMTGTVDNPKIHQLGEASKLLGTLMMRNSSAADIVSSKLKLPRWIAAGIGGGVFGRGNVADMGVRMPPLP